MTTDQAVNRQADHENLIRELADALGLALDEWADWYDYGQGDVAKDSLEYREARAVLAKVQS